MSLFGLPEIEELKARRDVQGLIEAVGYPNSIDVRVAATEALGEIQDAQAVEPLVARLRDESEAVRRAAAEALERLGWQSQREAK